MRIGIIAVGLWRSVHLDMAKALQARGHQVVVYTEDASLPSITRFARRVEDGVEILGIHHERRNPWLWLPDRISKALLGRRFFTTLFAIHRYLRRSRCDIYLVEGDWIGVFPALLGYLSRFRWVVSVHDPEHAGVRLGYPGEPSNRWRERIKRWVLQRADGVRTNSHVTRDILVQGGLAPRSVDVVPLHVSERMRVYGDLDAFRAAARAEVLARHRMPADCELLLAACRLTPIKGLELSVRAFAELRTRRPRARLLVCGGDRSIAGTGSYRGVLERLAADCKAESAIVFAGDIESGLMKRYYAAADVHVVTSYIETFSYAAVEAALAGTCTVMTDRIGAGHWLEAAGAAVVVKGRVAEDFAAGIERALARLPDAAGARGMAERTAAELSLERVSAALEVLLMRYVPTTAPESAIV
jgi:glycosyltransferase involved in cell wall biosynthesis